MCKRSSGSCKQALVLWSQVPSSNPVISISRYIIPQRLTTRTSQVPGPSNISLLYLPKLLPHIPLCLPISPDRLNPVAPYNLTKNDNISTSANRLHTHPL